MVLSELVSEYLPFRLCFYGSTQSCPMVAKGLTWKRPMRHPFLCCLVTRLMLLTTKRIRTDYNYWSSEAEGAEKHNFSTSKRDS